MAPKTFIILSLLAGLLSSCATVMEGMKEKVVFTSNPSGIKVKINGKDMGNTPFYTKLEARKNYEVTFCKDSSVITVPIKRKIQPGFLVCDIIAAHTFYLSPMIAVDAITGAWFKLDKNYIHVDYEKQNPIK